MAFLAVPKGSASGQAVTAMPAPNVYGDPGFKHNVEKADRIGAHRADSVKKTLLWIRSIRAKALPKYT